MKPLFALIAAAALGVVAWTPTAAKAQMNEWPTYGSVYGTPNQVIPRSSNYSSALGGANQYTLRNNMGTFAPPAQTSFYTPGYGVSTIAPNGAIHYYYTPGHPSTGNDRGPMYYAPAFKTYHELPGHIYYYYGKYGSPRSDYSLRR
jgi:hypothetical protein